MAFLIGAGDKGQWLGVKNRQTGRQDKRKPVAGSSCQSTFCSSDLPTFSASALLPPYSASSATCHPAASLPALLIPCPPPSNSRCVILNPCHGLHDLLTMWFSSYYSALPVPTHLVAQRSPFVCCSYQTLAHYCWFPVPPPHCPREDRQGRRRQKRKDRKEGPGMLVLLPLTGSLLLPVLWRDTPTPLPAANTRNCRLPVRSPSCCRLRVVVTPCCAARTTLRALVPHCCQPVTNPTLPWFKLVFCT